jgi:hypothetical protein
LSGFAACVFSPIRLSCCVSHLANLVQQIHGV